MQVLSIISLFISSLLTSALAILKLNTILYDKYPKILEFVKKPIIVLLLLIALYFYRFLGNAPRATFATFLCGNMGIIMSFYFIRFHFIIYTHTTKFTIFLFLLLGLISTFFGLLRLFFRLGFIINTELQNNKELVFILENFSKNSTSFFTYFGKRLAGHMPPNPGSTGIDRHFALGLGTFVATSIGATSGVYLGYEAYQSRQVNIRLASIAERTLDIQERNSGEMTQENFVKKWDEFGNRRK